MRDDERLALAVTALGDGGGEELEAVVFDHDRSLTRFTHNAIHQNLADEDVRVTIRAVVRGRAGSAAAGGRDPAALRAARERAIAQTAFAPEPVVPTTLPQSRAYLAPSGAYDEATATATPAWRARAASHAFAESAAVGGWAAGFVRTQRSGIAIANTNGVRAAFASTDAAVNVKCILPHASGYAEGFARRTDALDPGETAYIAARKAHDQRTPEEVEPGAWTVVVEPPAMGELMAYLVRHFSAQAFDEGSSFLSDGLGKTYMGENVTITDDYAHPLQAGRPFDTEGTPTQRVTLIDAGAGAAFVTDTEWATRLQVPNTGHYAPEVPYADGPIPLHIVVGPGTRTRDELIAATERGILVSRFWYIRNVEPRKTIVTGMTRDGTFLIEHGRITKGLRNFRFNVSLLELMRACELGSELARTGQHAYEMVVPAARFERFTFTSVTHF